MGLGWPGKVKSLSVPGAEPAVLVELCTRCSDPLRPQSFRYAARLRAWPLSIRCGVAARPDTATAVSRGLCAGLGPFPLRMQPRTAMGTLLVRRGVRRRPTCRIIRVVP